MIPGTIARSARQCAHFDSLRGLRAQSRGASRLSWTRLNKLVALAARNGLGNCTVLARQFGVTTKTIHRDLTHLVRVMELPIRYDHLQNRYVTLHPQRDSKTGQEAV